ncbi:MAG: hypothetical protein ABR962_05300 [Candidatus Bathyarchaeia archaeon]
MIITTQKETAADIQSYTCSNPSCSKSFAKPLKAVNLSLENPEPYLACPHCLTDITTQQKPSIAEARPVLDAETLKTAKDGLEEEKAALQPAKTLCTHHFGYLSERSSKEKIPEECMACAEIVNCMLKAVRSCTGN